MVFQTPSMKITPFQQRNTAKAADILLCLWIESNKEEVVEPRGNRSLILVKISEEDPVGFLCKDVIWLMWAPHKKWRVCK